MDHTRFTAVVFDWAGTVLDHGSFAPMGAFVRLFANHGVTLSIEQARGPMGLPELCSYKFLIEGTGQVRG